MIVSIKSLWNGPASLKGLLCLILKCAAQGMERLCCFKDQEAQNVCYQKWPSSSFKRGDGWSQIKQIREDEVRREKIFPENIVRRACVCCAVLCSELQRAAVSLPATPVLSELNTVSLLVPISEVVVDRGWLLHHTHTIVSECLQERPINRQSLKCVTWSYSNSIPFYFYVALTVLTRSCVVPAKMTHIVLLY